MEARDVAETFDQATGELYPSRMDADAMAPAWRIDSVDLADWALSKIGAAKRRKAATAEKAAAAKARIDAWAAEQDEAPDRDIRHFTTHLELYAEENRATLLAGGGKSVKFPRGKLSWRKTGGGLKVVDPGVLYLWAKSRGLTRITEDTDVTAVKEIANASGATPLTPPGMERVPESDRLSIATTEEGRDGRGCRLDD